MFFEKTIFIIDDSQVFVSLLKSMLIRFGFKNENIDSTTESEKALRILKNNFFDIVFCDYNMNHHIDGALILDEIKTKKLLNNSSVFICLTGDNSLSVITYFIELEPDDYLIKPFKANDLIDRLKKVINRKKVLHPLISFVDNRKFAAAISLCEKLKLDSPQYTPYILRIEADCHLKLNEIESAKRIYLEASKISDSLWPEIGYGNTLRIEGEYEKAKDIFKGILKLKPTHPIARKNLAMCMLASNDILGALSEFGFLKKVNPANPQRDLVLANLLFSTGDFDASTQGYQRYSEKVEGTSKFDPKLICISILAKLLSFIEDKDKILIDDIRNDLFHSRESYINDYQEDIEYGVMLNSLASILLCCENKFHDAYLISINLRTEEIKYNNFYTTIVVSQMYALCGLVSDYKETMNVAKILVGEEKDESIMLSKLELYQGITRVVKSRMSTSHNNKLNALKLREEKKPKAAFCLAYDAYKIAAFNSDICLLLLELVALSTPVSMTRNEIKNLIKSCFWTTMHDKKSSEKNKELARKFYKTLSIKLEI
ncbi:response regulator [Vibrio splendidus]|uniref:response regulator n=1 Tax=Vibrio splendidus TaxID=29497 RepID=UPI00076AD19B|nr:response regulator [Vibrio splendidus]